MKSDIPLYIPIIFLASVLITLYLLYRIFLASNNRDKASLIMLAILIWLSIQGGLSYSQFYLNTVGNTPPPFTLMGFIPAFLFIAYLFLTVRGKLFIDSLPLFELSLLSIVRIPVEFILYWLFVQQLLPEEMTFQGYNFDIIAGLTAPLIAYWGIKKKVIPRNVILLWNYVSLILLLTIIILSVFSFPSFIQGYAFQQPNIGMLYFPFFWLPSFIVPVVFFSHLVAIRRLKT